MVCKLSPAAPDLCRGVLVASAQGVPSPGKFGRCVPNMVAETFGNSRYFINCYSHPGLLIPQPVDFHFPLATDASHSPFAIGLADRCGDVAAFNIPRE